MTPLLSYNHGEAETIGPEINAHKSLPEQSTITGVSYIKYIKVWKMHIII